MLEHVTFMMTKSPKASCWLHIFELEAVTNCRSPFAGWYSAKWRNNSGLFRCWHCWQPPEWRLPWTPWNVKWGASTPPCNFLFMKDKYKYKCSLKTSTLPEYQVLLESLVSARTFKSPTLTALMKMHLQTSIYQIKKSIDPEGNRYHPVFSIRLNLFKICF